VPAADHFSHLQQRINFPSLSLKEGTDLVSEIMCLKILNETKQYPKYVTYTVKHVGLLGCDTSTGGVIPGFSVALYYDLEAQAFQEKFILVGQLELKLTAL
jgi:hypothetical protein